LALALSAGYLNKEIFALGLVTAQAETLMTVTEMGSRVPRREGDFCLIFASMPRNVLYGKSGAGYCPAELSAPRRAFANSDSTMTNSPVESCFAPNITRGAPFSITLMNFVRLSANRLPRSWASLINDSYSDSVVRDSPPNRLNKNLWTKKSRLSFVDRMSLVKSSKKLCFCISRIRFPKVFDANSANDASMLSSSFASDCKNAMIVNSNCCNSMKVHPNAWARAIALSDPERR